jgi:sister chromatid cohesion protein DCC1
VLCTDDKAYQIRQVQTSNSMLLVQSRSASGTEISATTTRLHVISQPTSTLELHSVKLDAIKYIEAALPVFYGSDSMQIDTEEPHQLDAKPTMSRRACFSNIPACSDDCETAFIELMGFETDQSAYVPAPKVALDLYSAFITAGTVEKVDMTRPFSVSQIWSLLKDEDYPEALWKALLQRLSSHPNVLYDVQLDRKKTVYWVGKTILQGHPSKSALTISDLKARWRDLLPEQWRVDVNEAILQDTSSTPSPGTIKFEKEKTIAGNHSSKSSLAQRKWHEKFRNTAR